MKRIGWVGLGIMGSPMAANLLRAGFQVAVYSRTRAKVEALTQLGAVPMSSPAEVAGFGEATILMLPDAPDDEEVLFGTSGVVEGAGPNHVVVDMATIAPSVTRVFAHRLAARGIEMLDAPVSGGETGAREATLAIMVGGKEEVYQRCLPIFRALGHSIFYMGPHGAGQMTKLCNQIAGVLTLQSVVEALLFAKVGGLDPARVIEVLSAGSADSWNLRKQGPKMLARDFAPGFYVRLQQKDLRIALDAAAEMRLPLPGTALVRELFRVVEANGGGELGVQALVTALERMAGRSVG
ncbi:MAG: tartronate semialdehyde reductase [Candidatus Binatia bacterium]|nr:MAG: tartronate semialdehyde reductase [Candidatus Binatia bacterium]